MRTCSIARSPNNSSLTQRLNTPLRLERPIYTDDGGGGRHQQWEEVASIWAQIETISAKEKERDGRLIMLRTHHIFIRPRNDLDATMRLRDGARLYYITGFLLLSENTGGRFASQSQPILRCNCEEVDHL